MRLEGSSEIELVELPREGDFARARERLDLATRDGSIPGGVIGVWDASMPDRIRVAAAGKRRIHPRELPALEMVPETVFDLASLTKVMGTATLAATLVDRRWIAWDTPLAAILPQAARRPGATRGELIEVRHLLSHTAGYVAWEPLWERMRERFAGRELFRVSVAERQRAMRERVLAIAPEVRPGERAVYSDISFLLLGFALEEVTGMPLDGAVRRFVWDPMGLETAYYRHVTSDVASARRDEVAATEDCPWRGGVLQGQVHDDNCWSMGGYAGHAGAFGTVRDVLQFARAIYPGVGDFLSREALRAAWTRAPAPADCSRTLGWDTPSGDQPSAGPYCSSQTVGHLGFTGTSLWIDPERGRAVTILTNRVHPTRENNAIRELRRDLGALLMGPRAR